MKAVKSMNYSDFLGFQNEYLKNNIGEFVENHIATHKEQNLTFEEVLSLALLHTIKQNKLRMLTNILSQYCNLNVLSAVDSNQFSPISYVLTFRQKKSEALKIIQDFLQSHEIPKKDLNGRDLLNIRAVVSSPLGIDDYMTVNDNFEYLKKNFLSHVYTDSTLQELKKSFAINFNAQEYLKRCEQHFNAKDANLSTRLY